MRKSNSQKYDLLLLDIDLPKMNGIDLAKAMLEVNKNAKISYITAYASYSLAAYEVHAFSYILKPFSKEKLFKEMDEILQFIIKILIPTTSID